MPIASQQRVGLVQRARRPATAAASARRAWRSRRAGRRRTSRAPDGRAAATVRRPSRIATRPVSPRGAARAPWRWPRSGRRASAASRRSRRPARRAPRRRSARRRRRPRRAARAPRPGVSSPSQPAPKTAPRRRGRRASSAARRRAGRRRRAGWRAPASSPWASTSPPTSTSTTRSQPSSRGGVERGRRPPPRARVGVDQHGRLAEERGHVRLGEAEAAGAGGAGPGERGGRVDQRLRRRSISSRRRGPGSGSTGRRSQVSPPTTASVPERAGELGDGQRADDVAAAADAEARTRGRQRAIGARSQQRRRQAT